MTPVAPTATEATQVPTAEPTPSGAGPVTTDTDPSQTSTTKPTETKPDPKGGSGKAAAGDDWLTTDGNKIVDKNGTQVWLTGVNWFGYNTGTNIFDGCWSCNMDAALKAIADHGFNLLRIPISAELINNWKDGVYPQANFNQATNAELVGMNSQEIFDYALRLCKKYGIKVMIDIHSANTDASGHMTNLWYTDKVSLQDYYSALVYIANRYKNDDTIVAYDLKNEPHGKPNEEKAIWNDSELDNNWRYVAKTAGWLILKYNPNALIVIEGIEIYPKDIKANGDFSSTNDADYYFNWWGGNLRGVKDYPIDFGSEEKNRQIVYSPHDYGPTVYKQPWFEGSFTYESLKKDCWDENWFYIYEDGTAPILIGEWGGFMNDEANLSWMTDLRQLISNYHLNYTFWCFNANSSDTGGLVKDDFTTWDNEKYEFVKEVLWQEDGKFVGLDHEVPLGANGISLSAYAGTITNPENPSGPTETTASETTETSEPSASTPVTPAAAAAATAAKKGVPAGKIVGYGFLALLLILVCICVYLYIKRPKDWNRFIDRFNLPEKLKRDIPWEVAPEAAATTNASANNEFAGRFRPVARTSAPSEETKAAAAPKATSAASSPFKPAPTAPAAQRPATDRSAARPTTPAAPTTSAVPAASDSPFKPAPAAPVAQRPAAARPSASAAPAAQRPATARPAARPTTPAIPAAPAAPSASDSPFKPARPESPFKAAPIKRPNMRPAALSPEEEMSLEERVNRLAEQMKAEEAARQAALAKAEAEAALNTTAEAEKPQIDAAPKTQSAAPSRRPSAFPMARPAARPAEAPTAQTPSAGRPAGRPAETPAARPAAKPSEADIPPLARMGGAGASSEAPKEDLPPIVPTWAHSEPEPGRPIWAKSNNTQAEESKPAMRAPIKRPNLRPSAKKPDDPTSDEK